MTALADKLFDLFRGRDEVHARAMATGGFRPTDRPLTAADLEAYHLAAKCCLGFYVLNSDSRCWVSAVDFDEKSDPQWKEHALEAWAWCQSAGLECLLEQSQSGAGAHVWLFFEAPIDAWVARAFWRWVGRATSLAFKEIFPKQDRLAGKGYGNLIRYPLWGKSCFVDDEWKPLEPAAALAGVVRYGFDVITDLAARANVVLQPDPSVVVSVAGSELPDRVAKAVQTGTLKRRWEGDAAGLGDQSRSGVAFAFAVECIRRYMPTHEIETALAAWCEKHGSEKGTRPDWVKHTVMKAYDAVIAKTEQASTNDTTMKDATHAFIDSLERGDLMYCRSGVKELDKSIDGVGFGELCLIAARPSQGKTAFSIQWLDQMTSEDMPALFLSEEMGMRAIGKRNLQRISSLTSDNWASASIAQLRRETDSYYKDRRSAHLVHQCFTVERAEEVIDQHCGLHGVRLVVVDYLQLLRSRLQKRNEQVADVSVRLKHACVRNNVAMLCVAQLNREMEYRDGKNRTPKMSDLGDSGQLERDADLILVLDWPFMSDPNADKNQYVVHVLKRRNGEIRDRRVVTFFDPVRQRFG